MTLYKESEPGVRRSYKFVRFDNSIYIGEAHELHANIAKKDGVLASLDSAKTSDPRQVDAGLFMTSGEMLIVHGNSQGLELPVIPEARVITVTVFQAQSPKHKVGAI